LSEPVEPNLRNGLYIALSHESFIYENSQAMTGATAGLLTALSSLGKTELPAQLAQWLDGLDEVGRWALLKLVTGALRIGVSARLAKTAVAALGSFDPDDIEIVWPNLKPPYGDLFAWVEGRAARPARDCSARKSRLIKDSVARASSLLTSRRRRSSPARAWPLA
jgi:ATP-dependent DNA ligase